MISLILLGYSVSILALGWKTDGDPLYILTEHWSREGLPNAMYYVVVPLALHAMVFLRNSKETKQTLFTLGVNYILIVVIIDSLLYFVNDIRVNGERVIDDCQLLHYLFKVFAYPTSLIAFAIATVLLLISKIKPKARGITRYELIKFAISAVIIFRIYLVLKVFYRFPAVYLPL